MERIRCRAVLFDWDGTLVDTLPQKVRNAGRIFGDILGHDPHMVEQAYRRYSGIPRRALFDAIAVAVGDLPLKDRVYAQLSKGFSALNQMSTGVDHVFPGVPATLSGLRSVGLTLIVSSSAVPEDIAHGVEATGLARHFADAWGSEDGFAKGPGHVSHACQKYGLQPWDICIVGDEPADIRLARDANARSVALEGTRSRGELAALEPDGVISEIAELLSLLAPT